jgi:hypothetical protein
MMTGIECINCKVLDATQITIGGAYCASCYAVLKKMNDWEKQQIIQSKITGEVPF